MNKILSYNNSIDRFTKDICITYKMTHVDDELSRVDNTMSMISLTIINCLNKKFKHSLHGYYVALIIKLLMLDEINVQMILLIFRILCDNMLLISKYITHDKFANICYLTNDLLFSNVTMLINQNNKDKLSTISKMAITFGWIFGCGTLNSCILSDLESAGNYFANMITISNSFDVDKYNIMFDEFSQAKQKFIEIFVSYGIFTDTVKNIINALENKIDCAAKQ